MDQNSASLNSYKILLVEDERDASDLYKEIIQGGITGATVEVAYDGKEALEKQAAGKFDLILLDIIMPVMDGIETLKTIRTDVAKYGSPKILMLSNLSGEVAEQNVSEFNVSGYVVKIDIEPEGLVSKIKEVLEIK